MFTDRPGMTPMTEDQIERHVQRKVDRLDQQFMSGKLTQEQYDAGMKEIDSWANAEYRYAHTAG